MDSWVSRGEEEVEALPRPVRLHSYLISTYLAIKQEVAVFLPCFNLSVSNITKQHPILEKHRQTSRKL